MPSMPSAGGDRMRTRSQAQGSDKRSADELEAAPPNSTKRLRAYHGYRQVLQPIGISKSFLLSDEHGTLTRQTEQDLTWRNPEEETKDDIRVKSESASPVPLFSRNNQVLTRRDSNVWDDGMHLPPSPPYLATTNQSSSPGGRTASRLTAKLRSRRARTDIGIGQWHPQAKSSLQKERKSMNLTLATHKQFQRSRVALQQDKRTESTRPRFPVTRVPRRHPPLLCCARRSGSARRISDFCDKKLLDTIHLQAP